MKQSHKWKTHILTLMYTYTHRTTSFQTDCPTLQYTPRPLLTVKLWAGCCLILLICKVSIILLRFIVRFLKNNTDKALDIIRLFLTKVLFCFSLFCIFYNQAEQAKDQTYLLLLPSRVWQIRYNLWFRTKFLSISLSLIHIWRCRRR